MPGFSRRDALILTGLGGAGFAASWLLKESASIGRDVGDYAIAAAARDDPGAPSGDAPGGTVTLVAYTDYRCGACRLAHPAMRQAVAEDGAVRIVYKDWPILGWRSLVAAEWAIAAHFQNRYEGFHDQLMRGPIEIDVSLIEQAAVASGVDWTRLAADHKERATAISERLVRHAREAFGLGLAGTPGYLVGPLLVKGALGASDFRRVFDAARSHPSYEVDSN